MMQTMVPLYGFGGGSGGTGATLTVNAPAGCTVTVSKDGKTKTKTAGTDGVAVFKGLATGQWTVTITDGEQTAQKTVTITADYSAEITFFSATIHVTYPAGSTCTATDGTTTLTAPDTSGTWDCVVPNAAVWTVSLDSGFAETVDVTTSGVTYTVDKWHLYNRGNECTAVTGGWGADDFGYSWAGVTGNISPITKNENSIVISGVAGSKVGIFGTKNKIDITKYTKLTMKYSLEGSNANNSLYLSSSRDATINTAIAKASCQIGNNQTAELDLTGVTDGSYYVLACVDGSAQMEINAISVES